MSISLPRTILAASLPLLLAIPAWAGDWARFRGPNGTGVSTERNIPVTWADKDLLWKTAIPGYGISSPVVAGGKIFLLTAARNGSNRSLVCVNASDGKVLWTKNFRGGAAKIHALSSFASSTPAADAGSVYAAIWDGKAVTLYAFDHSGNELWKFPLGSFTSQHGAGASPIVHDGKVFILDDQDGSSRIVAVDAKTGKLTWEKKRTPFRACYSTPAIRSTDNGEELVVLTTAGLTGYDPKTGNINWNHTWRFDGMGLRTVASPVLIDGLAIGTSGDGRGDRHAIAVKLGGKGELPRSSVVWENRKSLPYVPSMLAHEGHLYFVNDSGIAFCIEAKTGKEKWSQRLGAKHYLSSPVMIDGKVYAIHEKGKLTVFAASPKEYKELGTVDLGEGVSATPAVADGKLIIRGENHLFCIGGK